MKALASVDRKVPVSRGSLTEELSDAQRRTIRQLEREEVCAGRIVEVEAGCGWAQVKDDARHLVATIDRAGNLLGLDGPGRRRRGRSH
jgi:hypothetical protein